MVNNKYVNKSWTGWMEPWIATTTTWTIDNSVSDEESEEEIEMILPEIIYEPKNDVYVAKFPNGDTEVDILKPNHGDEYDLEKGLLYYVIKKNLNLGEVLEWMRPILDETQRPENIAKKKKEIKSKIKKWFLEKNDKPIDDKECQKIINNEKYVIDTPQYLISVKIAKNGITKIYDKENNEMIKMIKPGFPSKGFLRHLIYKMYNKGKPSLEYYQLKKLTYRFYKGCFDSVEKERKYS